MITCRILGDVVELQIVADSDGVGPKDLQNLALLASYNYSPGKKVIVKPLETIAPNSGAADHGCTGDKEAEILHLT